MHNLSNKVIVITGGGSGIGLACAQLLLESGARVGVSDITLPPALDALSKRYGERFVAVKGDVTQPDDVQRNHSEIRARLGDVNGLVCSAGATTGKTLIDSTPEIWKRCFAINVEGVFLWMQAVGAGMIERRSGSVVVFASQLVRAGGRGNAAYISAKAALIGLMRSAALEWSEYGVRVNALVPGVIDTPMVHNGYKRFDDPQAAFKRAAARHPLGRLGQPEEVARAAGFLLSDDSSFTTGSELTVDGGWSIG